MPEAAASTMLAPNGPSTSAVLLLSARPACVRVSPVAANTPRIVRCCPTKMISVKRHMAMPRG